MHRPGAGRQRIGDHLGWRSHGKPGPDGYGVRGRPILPRAVRHLHSARRRAQRQCRLGRRPGFRQDPQSVLQRRGARLLAGFRQPGLSALQRGLQGPAGRRGRLQPGRRRHRFPVLLQPRRIHALHRLQPGRHEHAIPGRTECPAIRRRCRTVNGLLHLRGRHRPVLGTGR